MKIAIQKQMHQEIKNASNVEEIFTILGKYYDLKNSCPGGMAKGLLIIKLPDLVTTLSVKTKSQYK